MQLAQVFSNLLMVKYSLSILLLDAEHKFDLAIQLGDLDCAYTLAKESASEQKWKQLAELATSQAKFELAQQCLHEAQV